MVTPRSTATRAVISRSALVECAAAAVAAGGEIADLRRDAYGHGVLPVARAVLAAGARAVRVDGAEQARLLRSAGLAATDADVPDIDAELLYGLPGDGQSAPSPVMRLTGTVMSIKPLRRGEAVSYGYTHRAAADTTLALVAGGYAQAIVRALGNRAHVELRGRMVPIVGRIAMDVCVIDLGGSPVLSDVLATEGDEVTYFGGAGPARAELRAWAAATGLTAAELVCAAGLHASRVEGD
ncbi:MAG: alanine racemase C-terminal domain-containing protein [Microbacterium sp.]